MMEIDQGHDKKCLRGTQIKCRWWRNGCGWFHREPWDASKDVTGLIATVISDKFNKETQHS